MSSNPFASVFRNAFEQDVLKTALYVPKPEDRSDYEPRVRRFMTALNSFFRTSGLNPVLYQAYRFNETKLLDYALFLRGYMRDSQKILADLKPQDACDPSLIRLFEASSEYAVACNRQFGNKKVFTPRTDYCLWQIGLKETLSESPCRPAQTPDSKRHNMFLFMPFRIHETEDDVRRWVFTNMQNSLDHSAVLGKDVDLYVNFYPIEKSRSENVTSLLKTLKDPHTYIEDADRAFVQNYWRDFIAQDLKTDSKGNVISCRPYTPEQLKAAFADISIFSYCSGTANAHRCLNALYQTTGQIYGEQTAREAMAQIGVMSYGFLPLENHSLYSGVHFYSNIVNNAERLEPFVNLNNHALYEKTKCIDPNRPARYSVMPDRRNFIVALNLPDQVTIWKDKEAVPFRDKENGHSILFLTRPRVNDPQNYAHNVFQTAFNRFCMGRRGVDVLAPQADQRPSAQLMQRALTGQMRTVRFER